MLVSVAFINLLKDPPEWLFVLGFLFLSGLTIWISILGVMLLMHLNTVLDLYIQNELGNPCRDEQTEGN